MQDVPYEEENQINASFKMFLEHTIKGGQNYETFKQSL